MAAIAAASPAAPQWNAAQFEEMLQPAQASGALRRTVLVAESAGELAGFAVASAVCTVFPAEAELESIVVGPAMQRQGIGRALLEETLAWASSQGAESLLLEVRESNARAIGIYRKAGFRQSGIRPGYYAAPVEAAVVMERTVDRAGHGTAVLPLA